MTDAPATGPGSVQPFKTLGDDEEHDPIGIALAKAAEQFHAYAKDHTRKAEMHRHRAEHADEPARENRFEDAAESERKAQVNAEMAAMMEDALLTHTAKLDA